MTEIKWSETEEKIAQVAFDKAYQRETTALIEEIRQYTGAIATLDDTWRLHDFLSSRRHDIDGKYDYRYPVLLFVFARLVQEKWLDLSELDGLDREKLAKIASIAMM
ncbi:hypothetical protein [Merismopedia glauca]|uniref:hypothetical protein n=1 Tax=Merismopedia glauca TaxID=292586 RepID=UPI001C63ADFF|nr:hypothetical protein [Merismopedia glauca]